MEVPLIGLGTWQLTGEDCIRVVPLALELGYRHIDTAHVYRNHEAIRKGMKGFDRRKLYITSKISVQEQVNKEKVEESVQEACERALKELGIDYLDLYLIHSPDRSYPLDRIFKELENLKKQGKIKEAGVSNYNIRHLEDLKNAGFTPFANQVEFHPYLNQNALLEYCRKHHIKLISFRSFGKGKLLIEEPIFGIIGKKYQKTGAQVILRWTIQKNIPVIPKASSYEHLKENLDIFDFSLTDKEMDQLDHLNRNKRYCLADNPEYSY